MADFCQQCSLEMFDMDFRELAELGPKGSVLPLEHGWTALCEGCGPTLVDQDGKCIAAYCPEHGTTERKTMTHPELVKALVKTGEAIKESITSEEAHLLHMAVGVSGEAGEILDNIKKHVIYKKPFDRANMLEELGDIEFYLEGIRQGAGITRAECLTHNIAKLSTRYHKGSYSDTQAHERADKQDGQDH